MQSKTNPNTDLATIGCVTPRSLSVLETEIKAHSLNAASSIIAIGRALIEAKAQVKHGEWSGWLRDRVQFSQSTAGNFMRIAREVKLTPSLEGLPYTKILPLLSVPAEERDAVIQETDAANITSEELKRAVAERDKAKREAKQQGDLVDRYSNICAELEGKLKTAEIKASRIPDEVRVEVPPADYDHLKARAKEAERFAEQAERDKRLAQEEAQRLRRHKTEAKGTSNNIAAAVTEACGTLIGSVGMAQYDDFAACPVSDIHSCMHSIDMLLDWCSGMKQTLSEAKSHIVDSDFSVE